MTCKTFVRQGNVDCWMHTACLTVPFIPRHITNFLSKKKKQKTKNKTNACQKNFKQLRLKIRIS